MRAERFVHSRGVDAIDGQVGFTIVSHEKRRLARRGVHRDTVREKGLIENLVPVGLVLCHIWSEKVSERLVETLGKTIRLWAVRCRPSLSMFINS
jgi:hypothetical protein